MNTDKKFLYKELSCGR